MLTYIDIIIRLSIAFILGGAIGLEREGVNRPAGFRTHILVCIGSTLIMLTGIYITEIYKGTTDLDPARLGAQVVSGIGFLGAGTIIKEGVTVKGLTTAASLWAVAGIGLACGSGFYFGAAISTAIILISLIVFYKFEKIYRRNNREFWIELICEDKPGLIGKVGTQLGKLSIHIKQISLNEKDNKNITLRIVVRIPRKINKIDLYDYINEIDGVESVTIE